MLQPAFIQKVTIGLFSELLNPAPSGKTKPILFCGSISGIGMYSLNHIYHLLSPTASLILKREQNEKENEFAISVWFRNFKLGYIPRNESRTLAKLLDGYYELKAQVISINKEKFLPPSDIRISVFR